MQDGRVDNRRREKNNERVHCDKGTRSYYRPSWVWEGPWSQKASWVIEGNVWFDADVESSWQRKKQHEHAKPMKKKVKEEVKEEKEDVDFPLDGCDIGNSPSINFSKKIPRDSNEDDE